MRLCFASQNVDPLFHFWCNGAELFAIVCFCNVKHCKIYKQYVKMHMYQQHNK